MNIKDLIEALKESDEFIRKKCNDKHIEDYPDCWHCKVIEKNREVLERYK